MSELTLSLKNKRTEAQKKLDALLDKAKNESGQDRAFTADEQNEFNLLEREIIGLNESIKTQERRDQAELARASRAAELAGGLPIQTINNDEKNLRKNFSIRKMLHATVHGRALKGSEAEMDSIAQDEMRESGIASLGYAIPQRYFNVPLSERQLREKGNHKRDYVVGTDANGGYLVDTTLQEYEPILRPETILPRLGCRMMPGLRNNITFPPQITKTAAAWRGESGAAGESQGTFSIKSMEPHGLSVTSDYTLEMLNQGSIAVEDFIAMDQNAGIGEAIDAAFFNGSGAGNVPLGALNNTDIPDYEMGTNGANLTRSILLAIRKIVKNNDGYQGTFKWVTNHEVVTFLEDTLLDAGSGKFLKDAAVEKLMGQDILSNTLIPSDLDKGTSTGVCSALLLGRWDKYMVGQWGGVSFTVDKFTGSKNGIVSITTHTWWDFLTRQPNQFVRVVDITTT